ncbi:MAG TPA: SDR family oxidoreductase [Deltaproteobacteria bacterium]|nr:SDR family oxidoreductase [Deltaproteobacteria bacterium]
MAGFRGLRGRRALITGAASGIGLATAERLAEEGAVIGVLDLDTEGAEKAVGKLRELGAEAFCLPADIVDPVAVAAAVGTFEADAGPVEALINNAGWDVAGNFAESDPAIWKKIIDINLYGPLNMTRAVLPGMIERRAGRIVSLASDAGRVGSSGEAVYAACKGGIIAFSKSVAREVARHGITLNVVSPGPSDTPLFARFDESGKLAAALERAIPMRRLGRPEDYPGIIAFLISDDAGFITGQTVSVSGGLTMHG